jgi:hypothetical protein
MTREKALQVSSLLYKIEAYEALRDEITGLQTVAEIRQAYDDNIEEELLDVVVSRLYKLTKELEEL